jgi:MoxR-like ATPase
MNERTVPIDPVLRDTIISILDLDSRPSAGGSDLAEFLAASLATHGRLLLVDSSARDLRNLCSLVASLDGSEAFHHFATPKVTCADLVKASQGRKVWYLEEIDALDPVEQAMLGDLFLEDQSVAERPSILIASVTSTADAETLSEELLHVFGAVVTLPKVGSDRLRADLLDPKYGEEILKNEVLAEWTLLKEADKSPRDVETVNRVVTLADRISSLDPSSVTERPPIASLRNQIRVLSALAALRQVYGEQPFAFEGITDFHVALLAHRLRRVDSEGKSNVAIVSEAVEKLRQSTYGKIAAALGQSSASKPSLEERLSNAKEILLTIRSYLVALVKGREDDGPAIPGGGKGVGTIDLLLAALFSEGHILFEDYPGTGKSYMIEKLSDCIDDDIVEPGIDFTAYKHIQCVPDLLPGDLTGGEIYSGNRMVFRPGPVFAYLVLIDEINRTTPKVQAALLEAMADRKVTIGNHEYGLGRIFFVLATQNPLDTVGTYPLPQAQLDRFIFKRRLQPLDPKYVREILEMDRTPLPEIKTVRVSDLASAISSVREVPTGERINNLLLSISNCFNQLTTEEGFQAFEKSFGERAKKSTAPSSGSLFRLKEGSTPSPRSLKKFMGGLRAIAFIEWAKGGGELQVTSDHIFRLARDYFTHRITPVDEEKFDPKTLGALVDLVVSEASARL